jgi:hypothetical protein
MKPPQQLLDQIEKFDCPIVKAILNVVVNEEGCYKLFDQEELIGCTREALRLDPVGQSARIVKALKVTDQIIEMLEGLLHIKKETVSLFVAFEAGRRFEREQVSLAELEKMMRVQEREKEGNI